jgi:secondary thiamine-phosphate synthase enzyme
MERIKVRSEAREQLKDITDEVNRALKKLGVDEGIALVTAAHTTAGIVVNENADPAVCSDMLDWLESAVPQSTPFRHAEGNSPAHIKATMVGQSVALPVEGGKLALGTWQGVFFAEFDGPRDRTVLVSAVAA